MTISISHLKIANELILKELSQYIQVITLREIMREIKIVFKGGFTLFIKYNDYGEYGYQLMYSSKKEDYERFDNYDQNWNVSTNPHHFHQLNPRKVIESPIIGDPTHDINLLSDFIIDKLKLE